MRPGKNSTGWSAGRSSMGRSNDVRYSIAPHQRTGLRAGAAACSAARNSGSKEELANGCVRLLFAGDQDYEPKIGLQVRPDDPLFEKALAIDLGYQGFYDVELDEAGHIVNWKKQGPVIDVREVPKPKLLSG